MIKTPRSHDFDNLEPPLDAAVRSVLSQPVPEDAIDRVKARAARRLPATAVLPLRVPDLRKRNLKTSRSLAATVVAAAALLAMVVMGITLLLDRSSGQAFAQVIEKVKAAGSVQVRLTVRLGGQPDDGKMFLDGNRLRIEHFQGKLVQVADLDKKRALFLDIDRKLAQPTQIDATVAQQFANPVDQLRRAKSSDAESMGEEILNGRRTQVYRLRKGNVLGFQKDIHGSAQMLVWVDAESQLPAKIVVGDPDPKARTEIRFDEFVWNQRLDPQLFSLDIPAGFQVGTVMTTPPPTKPTQPVARSLDAPNVHADGILSRDRVAAHIVWNPQGTTITALMQDPESVPQLERQLNELRQWNVNTGRLRWSQPMGGAAQLAGTADRKFLATVTGQEMQLRDAASGKVIRKWATDKSVLSLDFSPDGKTLAAGMGEWSPQGTENSGGIQFWDVEHASLLRTIPEDTITRFVRYSVDGKHLASSSGTGGLKLWDTATGALTRIFPARLADFSPDGSRIACVSSGYKAIAKVDIYNLTDGSLVRSLTGEKATEASWLLRVAFSPDGHLLAAADWDGTVIIWNVATGERKHAFTEQAGVHVAVFAPDGATLATGSESRILRLWKLPAEPTQPLPEKK